MSMQERSHLWHHNDLNLNLFQASFTAHAYPRHSHDYYVIAVVVRGVQSFFYAGQKYITPQGSLILLNPADVHTGEPVDEYGYGFLALYPTAEHMQAALAEISKRNARLPFFTAPRGDDQRVARLIRALHAALKSDQSALENESRFIWTLTQVIQEFAEPRPNKQLATPEHEAVRKIRQYLDEAYSENITLSQLAEYVNFSRYYLLRVFRNTVGMPPHTYLDNVRIQRAQELIAAGLSLAEIATQVGYSSQSHFTQRFKQTIGITPGKYAQQIQA